MAIEFSKAAAALNKAAQLNGVSGMEARDTPAPGQFAEMVQDVAANAIESSKKAEAMSAAAIQEKADLTDVVTLENGAKVAGGGLALVSFVSVSFSICLMHVIMVYVVLHVV